MYARVYVDTYVGVGARASKMAPDTHVRDHTHTHTHTYLGLNFSLGTLA